MTNSGTMWDEEHDILSWLWLELGFYSLTIAIQAVGIIYTSAIQGSQGATALPGVLCPLFYAKHSRCHRLKLYIHLILVQECCHMWVRLSSLHLHISCTRIQGQFTNLVRRKPLDADLVSEMDPERKKYEIAFMVMGFKIRLPSVEPGFVMSSL